MPIGPRQAFEEMVKESADMLTCFLLALARDTDLVDELFQETCQAAWNKFETYDPDRSFGTYLREIAGKRALSKKVKAPRGKMHYFDRDSLSLLEVQFARVARTGGDRWENKVEALNQCLDILPKPSLDAVSMHYFRDNTCADIAQRLGVDEQVVKRRLTSSRVLLLDCIRSKLAETGEDLE